MSEKTKRHGVGRIGFEGCFKQCMCGQKFNDWNEFNAHIDGMFKELEANMPERTDERQAEIEAVLLDRIQILTQEVKDITQRRLADVKESGLYKQMQAKYEALESQSEEKVKEYYGSWLRADERNVVVADERDEICADRNALIRLNARLLDEADALRMKIEQMREDC